MNSTFISDISKIFKTSTLNITNPLDSNSPIQSNTYCCYLLPPVNPACQSIETFECKLWLEPVIHRLLSFPKSC